jgi:hypothetical protein
MAEPLRSRTTRWPALELFTDRHHACRKFKAYVHSETPPSTILFFHGSGGNGKTVLLRFLYEYYCKGIDPRRFADQTSIEQTLPQKPLPAAMLDFAPSPSGDNTSLWARQGLLQIRTALGAHKLQFPLFDYATVLYLKHVEGLGDNQIKTRFPAEEVDFIAAIIDFFTQLPIGTLSKYVGGLIGRLLGQEAKDKVALWHYRRRLNTADLEKIHRMDPRYELLRELPHLFAKDLNAMMRRPGAPSRVVLFFDTHEAFWGNQRERIGDLYFIRDEWLRCLLASLDRRLGIVIVVAGRELPIWHKAGHCPIAEDQVDGQQVDNFSDAGALEYLSHAGITDATLNETMISYTRVDKDQVHPFYLGLCTDMVHAAMAQNKLPSQEDFRFEAQGTNKGRVLVDRMLRYADIKVRRAVEVLSAARAFDSKIYFALGKALPQRFEATPSVLDVLTGFSFVWKAPEHGDSWYRIHPLICRLISEDPEKADLLAEAHTELEKYHSQRARTGERNARAEALYHEHLAEVYTELEKYHSQRARTGERNVHAEALFHANKRAW